MAALTLLREGNLLISRSPKIIATVPAPAVESRFDQCGVLTGFKINGSYSITGRLNCFDPFVDIQRVSFRANYSIGQFGIPGLGEELVAANLFVPNPPGFLKVRQNFQANPALPLELTADGSNGPLRDVCKVIMGTVEKKNLTKYGFTPDCSAITLYGYSTTVARHSSITDTMIQDTVTALLNSFYLTEQASGALATIDTDMQTAWSALAGVVLSIPLGAFE